MLWGFTGEDAAGVNFETSDSCRPIPPESVHACAKILVHISDGVRSIPIGTQSWIPDTSSSNMLYMSPYVPYDWQRYCSDGRVKWLMLKDADRVAVAAHSDHSYATQVTAFSFIFAQLQLSN